MNLFRKKKIFLDFAAGHNNPSAIYAEGVEAKKSLAEARSKVAQILNVQARDIIFNSGGTEADNLAILGVFEALKDKVARPHFIISKFEHPAVREAAKEVERRGGEVSVVALEDIEKNIKPNTVLISVIYVNGETGEINPVAKISRVVREIRKKNGSKWPYIHTDATQAIETLVVSAERLGVDLLTLERLLIVRPNVEIRPIIFGGGQERGLRAGTEDVLAIVNFANSLVEMEKSREKLSKHFEEIKKVFLAEVQKLLPEAIINSTKESVPNIVSISMPNKLHEFLAIKLAERGVFVSTGSACKNIGVEEAEALRFSFGGETTKVEVIEAARILSEVVL